LERSKRSWVWNNKEVVQKIVDANEKLVKELKVGTNTISK
jgi:hypothetical protein